MEHNNIIEMRDEKIMEDDLEDDENNEMYTIEMANTQTYDEDCQNFESPSIAQYHQLQLLQEMFNL